MWFLLYFFKYKIIIFDHFLHHFYWYYWSKFDYFCIFRGIFLFLYIFRNRIFFKTINSKTRFLLTSWSRLCLFFFWKWTTSCSASNSMIFFNRNLKIIQIIKFLVKLKIVLYFQNFTYPPLLKDSRYFNIISQAYYLFFKLPITLTMHSWFLFFSSESILI